MSPLVRKEVRLLAPAFWMALVLAIVPVWLLPNPRLNSLYATFYFFCFGTLMMALSSFGREFGLRTFPLLLSQPLRRCRMWWTKVGVLGLGTGTLVGVWWLSCAIRVHRGPYGSLSPEECWEVSGAILAVMVVTFAGALWTTLLLRQTIAAFWLTVLVPAAITTAVSCNGGSERMVLVALGLYAVAGFLLARGRFVRAQEVAWTGGVVTFSRSAPQSSSRLRRPFLALIQKEFQLHQIGLVAICALFVLHLGVVALRKTGYRAVGEIIRLGLESFGLLWLAVPFLVGSQSVAEERKLGTLDGLMSLAVSNRRQFALKLFFVLAFGGVLSGSLLWVAEGIARYLGAPWFSKDTPLILALYFLPLSVIAFYASTLGRNIIQALGIGVLTAMFLTASMMIFDIRLPNGDPLVPGILPHIVGWPAAMGALVWLAYGNFNGVPENWRLWRRNILGITAAVVFTVALSTAIYHRAWEFLTPLEPPHGPVRLTGSNPPSLQFGNGAGVLLPDGRLWLDRVIVHDEYPDRITFDGLLSLSLDKKWASLSGGHFIDGSNWVHLVANYRDTAGIQLDGTLWVSQSPLSRGRNGRPEGQPDTLVRVDDKTNWVKFVRDRSSLSLLLLQKDGTLWRWGLNQLQPHQKWPGLRAYEPYRVGSDSDWTNLLSAGTSVYLWKSNGQAWAVNPIMRVPKKRETELEPGVPMLRWESFDNTRWRSLIQFQNFQAGAREDGTLWHCNSWLPTPNGFIGHFEQIGHDADWVAAAVGNRRFVALKNSGSVYTWSLDFSTARKNWMITGDPVPLGTHHDWVALAGFDGIVSLAADGSIWHWPLREDDFINVAYFSEYPLRLRHSRKPAKIENIFN